MRITTERRSTGRTARRRSALAAGLGLAFGLLTLAACRGILAVDLPTRVGAGILNGPSFAPTMVQGAIADFDCAYTNYTAASGLLTDELIESTGFIAWFSWDLRRIFSNNSSLGTNDCTGAGYGVYTPLQTARFSAEDSYNRIKAFPDSSVTGKTSLLATAAAYEGYALVFLGEGFCQMAIDRGPALTPTQTLAKAETVFTTAIQLANTAGNTQILQFATVGRARARLDQGNLTGADADAQTIPAGFTYTSTYDLATVRRENRVYEDNFLNFYISVDPRYRNLMFAGVADPRVSVKNGNRAGNDGVTALWFAMKYSTPTSPAVIASWNEAQLIIAEAEGGQSAVAAINRLHTAAGLPAYSSTDNNAILQQVYEERRRELFLTGHRLFDMLRLNIPFDTGNDAKGQPFGTTTCMPLPDAETFNNPNLSHS